jgi:hypothetical protein
MPRQLTLRVGTTHLLFKPGHNLFRLILSAPVDRSMQIMLLSKHISKQKWLSSPATDGLVCLAAMKQAQFRITSLASHEYSIPTTEQGHKTPFNINEATTGLPLSDHIDTTLGSATSDENIHPLDHVALSF